MSNHITIELCAEDRARLDRLAVALERKNCDQCVTTAMEFAKLRLETKRETDPVQQALAETLAKASDPVEAPKNATEQAETSTPPTTPHEEEKATVEEPAQAQPAKTVDRAELGAKVIKLCAKGQNAKDQTKDIIRSYATTVKLIPEDKLTEVYKKLVELEKTLEG
jgi:uncharacterized protein